MYALITGTAYLLRTVAVRFAPIPEFELFEACHNSAGSLWYASSAAMKEEDE